MVPSALWHNVKIKLFISVPEVPSNAFTKKGLECADGAHYFYGDNWTQVLEWKKQYTAALFGVIKTDVVMQVIISTFFYYFLYRKT